MQPVRPASLPSDVLAYLARQTAAIEAESRYDDRVRKALAAWSAKNSNFFQKNGAIRGILADANDCKGYCHYCQVSEADEVEHIFPKKLYPTKTFEWENYLAVCGPCNVAKLNKFALRTEHGILHLNDNSPPPLGTPLFLNLRTENPVEYFELSFDTGILSARTGLPREDVERAEYTLKTVKLNRDLLLQARVDRYWDFYCILKAVVQNAEKLPVARERLHRPPNLMVWDFMKRQAGSDKELEPLFASCREFYEI